MWCLFLLGRGLWVRTTRKARWLAHCKLRLDVVGRSWCCWPTVVHRTCIGRHISGMCRVAVINDKEKQQILKIRSWNRTILDIFAWKMSKTINPSSRISCLCCNTFRAATISFTVVDDAQMKHVQLSTIQHLDLPRPGCRRICAYDLTEMFPLVASRLLIIESVLMKLACVNLDFERD